MTARLLMLLLLYIALLRHAASINKKHRKTHSAQSRHNFVKDATYLKKQKLSKRQQANGNTSETEWHRLRPALEVDEYNLTKIYDVVHKKHITEDKLSVQSWKPFKAYLPSKFDVELGLPKELSRHEESHDSHGSHGEISDMFDNTDSRDYEPGSGMFGVLTEQEQEHAEEYEKRGAYIPKINSNKSDEQNDVNQDRYKIEDSKKRYSGIPVGSGDSDKRGNAVSKIFGVVSGPGAHFPSDSPMFVNQGVHSISSSSKKDDKIFLHDSDMSAHSNMGKILHLASPNELFAPLQPGQLSNCAVGTVCNNCGHGETCGDNSLSIRLQSNLYPTPIEYPANYYEETHQNDPIHRYHHHNLVPIQSSLEHSKSFLF